MTDVFLMALDPANPDPARTAAVVELLSPHLSEGATRLTLGRDGYAGVSPRPWDAGITLFDPTDDPGLWALLHAALAAGGWIAGSTGSPALAVASAGDHARALARQPGLAPDDVVIVTDGATLLATVL